jgi:ribosome-binding factor A
LLKAAEAIREVVAASILTELRDPRVRDVTVVGVSVSPDMREAKVKVSIMGEESQQQLALRGLQNSAGFLQRRIADRIETRYIPRLQFEVDKGVQHSLEVGEILNNLRQEREEREKQKSSAASATQHATGEEDDLETLNQQSVDSEPPMQESMESDSTE